MAHTREVVAKLVSIQKDEENDGGENKHHQRVVTEQHQAGIGAGQAEGRDIGHVSPQGNKQYGHVHSSKREPLGALSYSLAPFPTVE